MAAHQSPPSPDFEVCQELSFDGSEHDLARHTLAWCAVEDGSVPTEILDHLLKNTRNSAAIPHHANLGWLLSRCMRSKEAVNRLYRDLDQNPDSIEFSLYAAISLMRSKEFDTARHVLASILKQEPSHRIARGHYAEAMMNLSQWSEGFLELEKSRGDLTPLQQEFCKDISRLWMGQDLKGKHIVIVGNNRVADEIQFSRYADDLAKLGPHKIGFSCSPELVEMMRSIRSINRVDSVLFEPYDYFIPVESLPFRLGITPEQVTGDSYIRCNNRRVELKRSTFGGDRPLLGICWRNHDPEGFDDEMKQYQAKGNSLPLEDLTWLLSELAGSYDIVSFQQQLLPEEREVLTRFGVKITDQEEFDCLETIAETISCLDEIITVDSPIAHLAGAIGVEAHVLLPYVSGWKWNSDAGKSGWYDSVKVHQKLSEACWADCLAGLLPQFSVTEVLQKAS